MPYVKDAHVALAVLTACGFLLRAGWMLTGSPLLARRWVRVAPHVVDTLLLLTGVTLAVGWRISPLAQPWLAAKLGALVVYVVLGSIALRRGRTRRARAWALAGALVALAWIFGAALTHRPAVLA